MKKQEKIDLTSQESPGTYMGKRVMDYNTNNAFIFETDIERWMHSKIKNKRRTVYERHR